HRAPLRHPRRGRARAAFASAEPEPPREPQRARAARVLHAPPTSAANQHDRELARRPNVAAGSRAHHLPVEHRHGLGHARLPPPPKRLITFLIVSLGMLTPLASSQARGVFFVAAPPLDGEIRRGVLAAVTRP